MQLNQLRYFLEISRTGNISAAAQNLYVSQPSLSQQIRKLEEELGIPLLIRHPKSVSLTDAGEQFALHAERIVNSSDQLVELMQKHSRLLSGTLRIGMTLICGYLGMFRLLSRYQAAMPGIQYKLTVQISDALFASLKSRSLHAAFLISTEESLAQHQDLVYHFIREDEYVAVVPASHPLSQKEFLEVQDLQDQNIVMPSRESIFSRQLELLLRTHGVTPHVLCELSHNNITAQLIEEDLGIGFVSSSIAEKLCPANGVIVPLRPTIQRSIYYVTLKELMDYPSVKSFSEYVMHYKF